MQSIKLHSDSNIGIKKLSKADLGQGTSHQTHIGLYEGVMDYLPSHSILSSIFLHDNTKDILPSYYDTIGSKNDSDVNRSPKIRKGDASNSTTLKIRDIATDSSDWYLLWFGLESDEIVFLLMEENSDDYNFVSNNISNRLITKTKILNSDLDANSILEYITNKYFKYESEKPISLLEEEISNKEDILNKAKKSVSNKFKVITPRYNLQNRAKEIEKIGKDGEKLVAQYLTKLLEKGELLSFAWLNQDSESGLPYDFELKHINGDIKFVDVKSTKEDENAPVFFSKKEIEFIVNNINNYSVFRVYDMNNTPKLKECSNIPLVSSIQADISSLQNNFKQKGVGLVNLNISIKLNLGLEYRSLLE